MKNRNVGYLISGIALVIGFIVYIFNNALKNIAGETCTHGSSCTMYSTISVQTWISVGIAALILFIGLFLIFAKEEGRIIVKKVREPKKKLNLAGLDGKEKEVIKILESENGTIFQAELMEKLGVGKVGITRLLDKLEAKQLIERKRRGMNNVVVLRN
jgi:uncharacterized membrane protein